MTARALLLALVLVVGCGPSEYEIALAEHDRAMDALADAIAVLEGCSCICASPAEGRE